MKQALFIFTIGYGIGAFTMPILKEWYSLKTPTAQVAKITPEPTPTPAPKVVPWYVPRNITLQDGRVYRNATIHSIRDDGIMLRTAGGVIKVESHLLDAATIEAVYRAKETK